MLRVVEVQNNSETLAKLGKLAGHLQTYSDNHPMTTILVRKGTRKYGKEDRWHGGTFFTWPLVQHCVLISPQFDRESERASGKERERERE